MGINGNPPQYNTTYSVPAQYTYNTNQTQVPNFSQPNTTLPQNQAVQQQQPGFNTASFEAPQFITGNSYTPYNPQYPGGYGANAAHLAWQYASRDPMSLRDTTIQMAPHPTYTKNETMVNLLGYAWEDFQRIDGLTTGQKDKIIDRGELAAYFQKAVKTPQAAAQLAQTWLNGYDTDKSGFLTVDEHLASNIFELGATSFLQRIGGHLQQAQQSGQYSTPAQQSMINRQLQNKTVQLFANITPFSTPAERTVKEKALFTQTELVSKITDSIKQGLQLQQYAKLFRLLPGSPPPTTPNVMSYQA